MVLAGEIVEEGSLAHIRGLRDVIDGDVLEAPLSKKAAGRSGTASTWFQLPFVPGAPCLSCQSRGISGIRRQQLCNGNRIVCGRRIRTSVSVNAGRRSPAASGKLEGAFWGTEASVRGERHCIWAVAFMVAGGGFEPPTFGL